MIVDGICVSSIEYLIPSPRQMRTSVTWKELGRRHLPRGIRFEGFEMRRDVEDYPGKRAAMEQNKVPKSAYISKGDSVDLGAYLEVLSVINGTINCAVLSKFVAWRGGRTRQAKILSRGQPLHISQNFSYLLNRYFFPFILGLLEPY
jgi:hypothetical protein